MIKANKKTRLILEKIFKSKCFLIECFIYANHLNYWRLKTYLKIKIITSFGSCKKKKNLRKL